MNSSAPLRRFGIALLVILCCYSNGRAQHGPLLSGVGSGNRAIGGVATGLALDPSGALRWNPATLSGFKESQLDFSVEALYPRTRISSAISPGTLAPGFPPRAIAGTNDGENGVFPLPSFGLVWVDPESSFTYGFGVACIGGFGLNYPANPGNPILSPQAPNGFGVGTLYSQYQLYEITPTVSYKLNENLSVGFTPILGISSLSFDPGFVFSPDDANGDGSFTYPNGQHTRTNLGGGFQIGVYWQGDGGWNFGASVKSPVWFEQFRYNTADELGRPRSARFAFDEPMTLSAGFSYTGIEKLTLGADLRYLDFSNTRGYRGQTFDGTGALQGLGWSSLYVIAVGGAYQVSDRFAVRAGYSYNNNPIGPENTFFNIASPLLIQHILSAGVFFDLTSTLQVSLSYARSLKGTSTGAFITPRGPIPGSTVTLESQADSLLLGVKVKF